MVQIPRWKKWLSHLFEFHLESAPSEHNPHLYVSLNRGRFQLCTANAVYSYGDLYDNFSTAFQHLDLSKLPGSRVLLLGLGLGSIPYMLEKNFGKKFRYTAVEIDESVVYLAHKYVTSELKSPIQVICADAFAYVQQCREQFDLIAMDIFLDDLVPEAFEQPEFLEQLKTLIAPDGLLMYNRLAYSDQDLECAKAFYEQTFRPAFPSGTFLEVKGNWMLLSKKGYVHHP